MKPLQNKHLKRLIELATDKSISDNPEARRTARQLSNDLRDSFRVAHPTPEQVNERDFVERFMRIARTFKDVPVLIPGARPLNRSKSEKEKQAATLIRNSTPLRDSISHWEQVINICKGLNLSPAEIALAIRKSPALSVKLDSQGRLRITRTRPDFRYRIKEVLQKSPEALTFEEIKQRVGHQYSYSTLSMSVCNDASILRLDRNLFGLKKHSQYFSNINFRLQVESMAKPIIERMTFPNLQQFHPLINKRLMLEDLPSLHALEAKTILSKHESRHHTRLRSAS